MRTRGWGIRTAAAAVAAVVVMAAVAMAIALVEGANVEPAESLRPLIRHAWPISTTELASIDNGTPIVKQVPADTPEDITFAGAIHINVPPQRFVERFRDIERFDTGKSILHTKQFQHPPSIDDLTPFTVRDKDVRSLAACTPGDCDVMLPADAIARFQKEIDWKAADAAGRASKLTRELLLARLVAYQQGGDRALPPYHSRSTPLDTKPAAQQVLARVTPIAAYLPELFPYLREFPRAPAPAGASDFYYWSEAEFGLKPTLRLNHVTIYHAPPNPAGIVYAIVTKQLYANHYFHTVLEVRFLVADGREPAGQGFYLVCWFDARSDSLTGMFGPIIRIQARRKSRAGIAEYLEHVKHKLEAPSSEGA